MPRAPISNPPERTQSKDKRRILEPQWIAFADHLRGILEKRSLTEAQFLILLNAAGCDIDRTMLSKVMHSRIAIPERFLGEGTRHLAKARPNKMVRDWHPMKLRTKGTPWADVLNLTGEERERFEELGWLARSHQQVTTIVTRLRKRIETLEKLTGDNQE